jgi:hypothetical protein
MEIIEDRSGYTIVMGDKGSGNTTLAIRTKFKLNGFKNHNPLYISINNLFDKVDFWQLLVWHCHLDEKKRPSLNNVSFVQIEGKVL